jgi:hypothetical protein
MRSPNVAAYVAHACVCRVLLLLLLPACAPAAADALLDSAACLALLLLAEALDELIPAAPAADSLALLLLLPLPALLLLLLPVPSCPSESCCWCNLLLPSAAAPPSWL